MISKKLAKWIAYHPKTVLIVCLILIIPSIIGYFLTGVNYDILSYLPENLESVQGEQILDETFHNSASSFIIVKDTEPKDIQKLEEQIRKVEGVSNVIGATDIADVTIPKEILPEVLTNVFYSQDGSSTLIMVQYANSGSSQITMDAIASIRKIMNKNMLLSGLSAITVDTKDLTNSQAPLYVVIAIALALIALSFTMTSWVLPFVLLAALGTAVIYNMGTNIIFGEISFITKSIAAILQLGVTVDYSVFLMDRFEEEKKRHDTNRDAMAAAIDSTFTSLMGSSLTTVFGFLALCFMSFTLGRDLGIVMSKGVILGVLGTVILLPCVIRILDRALEKTSHKPLLPSVAGISKFVTKHYKVLFVILIVLCIPAFYGYNNVGKYYDMSACLPQELESVKANTKLSETFDVSTNHLVLVDADVPQKNVVAMTDEMAEVDGVKQVLSIDSLLGAGIPESIVPDEILSELKSDEYQLMLISSEYIISSDAVNRQIDELNEILKKYDEGGMLIGEAPCTKDLISCTDHDFEVVSLISIIAIFLIIALVLRSISLPVILVAVIETAIAANLCIPYYTNVTLPFVAPILISTIQLGSTVDYAILMTTRYLQNRRAGSDKREAVSKAVASSAQSILVSGIGFFAATFGVGLYSNVDIISSMCSLMARGALCSVVVVLFLLPAVLLVLDKVIIHTTLKVNAKN